MALKLKIHMLFGKILRYNQNMDENLENQKPKRPMGEALKRGILCRCPNCGQGKLLKGYLKVNNNCASCGEDFTPQRADDGPAWATMLIAGHLIPPVILGIYDNYTNPNPFIVAIILILLFTALTLILLPRTKGAFIAVQWANYMYEFDPERKAKNAVAQA